MIQGFTQNYSKNLNILIHVMVLMANYFNQRWVAAVYPNPEVILTMWHGHSLTEVRGTHTSPPSITEVEVMLHDRRQNGFCLVFCLRQKYPWDLATMLWGKQNTIGEDHIYVLTTAPAEVLTTASGTRHVNEQGFRGFQSPAVQPSQLTMTEAEMCCSQEALPKL